MYTFMSINGSSGSCHPRRDAELIPICNRLLTDLHVVRKMKLYNNDLKDTLFHQNLLAHIYSSHFRGRTGERDYKMMNII